MYSTSIPTEKNQLSCSIINATFAIQENKPASRQKASDDCCSTSALSILLQRAGSPRRTTYPMILGVGKGRKLPKANLRREAELRV